MDPTNRGPEGHDEQARGHRGPHDDDPAPAPAPRPPRDPLTASFGQTGSLLPVRTVQLVSGGYLVTVNPVDGSEIEPCPPGELPPRPVKYTAAERADRDRAGRPPVVAGPAARRPPLTERREERERLVRLLARGRSVRLTGPAGSGRSTLLDAVADDCADLAPDGVIRLNGYRRTAADLLHDLCSAVYRSERHRPDRALQLELVHGIGAVVVVDDLEFGGRALEELLDAAPECAFVLSTTPDVAAPAAESHLEEVFLAGLDRAASVALLQRATGRPLNEEESQWAGDLWFESEGLPLRFLQAGALLRMRDRLDTEPGQNPEQHVVQAPEQRSEQDPGPLALPGPLELPGPPALPGPPVLGPPALPGPGGTQSGPGETHETPGFSLADGAAPAALLASRLSASARATLRFAVALGGEVPHQAHLPALVGDTHADAALGELVASALVSVVGGRYRLAAGVLAQLEATGFGDDAEDRARSAAEHYAWWSGHPSVTPERICAEAHAVLAALAALIPGTTPAEDGDEPSLAVRLARSAAPAFAAGLDWGAWERALRAGQEAARLAGEVAEEAYFHHELGILALCGNLLDRARAELEASIGLRGALADRRGTVAGRRALALVADRSGGTQAGGVAPAGGAAPGVQHEESASPPGGVPATLRATPFPAGDPSTLLTHRAESGADPADPKPASARHGAVRGTRRNLVAAGAGALLAAVLGTVVTLGATSDGDGTPSQKVGTTPSVSEDDGDGDITAEEPRKSDDSTSHSPDKSPGNSSSPTAGTSDLPADESTASGSPSKSPSKSPTKSHKPTKTPKPPTTPPDDPTTTPPSDSPSPSDPSGTPSTSDSASRPPTVTPTVTQGSPGPGGPSPSTVI